MGTLVEPLTASELAMLNAWLADYRAHIVHCQARETRPAMANDWASELREFDQLAQHYRPSRRVPDRVVHLWAITVLSGYRGEASRRYSVGRLRELAREWMQWPVSDRAPHRARRSALNGGTGMDWTGRLIEVSLLSVAYEACSAVLDRQLVAYEGAIDNRPQGPGRTAERYQAAIEATRRGEKVEIPARAVEVPTAMKRMSVQVRAHLATPFQAYLESFAEGDARAEDIEKRAVAMLRLAASQLDRMGVARVDPCEDDLSGIRAYFAEETIAVKAVAGILGIEEARVVEASRGVHGARSRWGAHTKDKERTRR